MTNKPLELWQVVIGWQCSRLIQRRNMERDALQSQLVTMAPDRNQALSIGRMWGEAVRGRVKSHYFLTRAITNEKTGKPVKQYAIIFQN